MCVCVCVCVNACMCVCMHVCSQASRSRATLSCDSSYLYCCLDFIDIWIILFPKFEDLLLFSQLISIEYGILSFNSIFTTVHLTVNYYTTIHW